MAIYALPTPDISGEDSKRFNAHLKKNKRKRVSKKKMEEIRKNYEAINERSRKAGIKL